MYFCAVLTIKMNQWVKSVHVHFLKKSIGCRISQFSVGAVKSHRGRSRLMWVLGVWRFANK